MSESTFNREMLYNGPEFRTDFGGEPYGSCSHFVLSIAREFVDAIIMLIPLKMESIKHPADLDVFPVFLFVPGHMVLPLNNGQS